MPPDLERGISEAYLRLCEGKKRLVRGAVRSSAVHEDGEFSFAGQYTTFLNVPGDSILQRYKDVVASLYSPGALTCYKTKGYHENGIAMSVGIQEMIEVKAAGVLYTRDPNSPGEDSILISAVLGLGGLAVEGLTTPVRYRVARLPFSVVRWDEIQVQTEMFVCRADGDIEKVPVPDSGLERTCLSEKHIKKLSDFSLAIEDHYGCPQDIEWAVDDLGRVFVVQTRPLVIPSMQAQAEPYTPLTGYRVLLDKGTITSRGIGCGRATIVSAMDDLRTFTDNAVLATKYTSTRFAPVIGKARALVTDIGSATMHMATIAREFGVPALVGTGGATRVIRNDQEVTVDAIHGIVYDEIVKELVDKGGEKKVRAPETRFLTLAKRVCGLIVPLTLVDTDGEVFRPECCKTLHDITRFAHQKAMHEMFTITSDYPEDSEVYRLGIGIPLCIDVIDLGESITVSAKKGLHREHIHSLPLGAFLDGLSALPWPEPRHIDVRGFFGMVAHTAAIPEEELVRIGERSFAFISREYYEFFHQTGVSSLCYGGVRRRTFERQLHQILF